MPSNPWILHVKEYAQKHNISYGCAITEAKASYKKPDKSKPETKPKLETKSKPERFYIGEPKPAKTVTLAIPKETTALGKMNEKFKNMSIEERLKHDKTLLTKLYNSVDEDKYFQRLKDKKPNTYEYDRAVQKIDDEFNHTKDSIDRIYSKDDRIYMTGKGVVFRNVSKEEEKMLKELFLTPGLKGKQREIFKRIKQRLEQTQHKRNKTSLIKA